MCWLNLTTRIDILSKNSHASIWLCYNILHTWYPQIHIHIYGIYCKYFWFQTSCGISKSSGKSSHVFLNFNDIVIFRATHLKSCPQSEHLWKPRLPQLATENRRIGAVGADHFRGVELRLSMEEGIVVEPQIVPKPPQKLNVSGEIYAEHLELEHLRGLWCNSGFFPTSLVCFPIPTPTLAQLRQAWDLVTSTLLLRGRPGTYNRWMFPIRDELVCLLDLQHDNMTHGSTAKCSAALARSQDGSLHHAGTQAQPNCRRQQQPAPRWWHPKA